MGHELRNPLNEIIGASCILEVAGKNERQEFRKKSANRLCFMETHQQHNGYFVFRFKQVVLESRPIHLACFIEQTLSSFVFQSYYKNTVIHHEIADHLTRTILGDPARLREIIINLTGNAIKSTHSGSVFLFLTKHHSYLGIKFIDTRIRMPEKNKQTYSKPMFERM